MDKTEIIHALELERAELERSLKALTDAIQILSNSIGMGHHLSIGKNGFLKMPQAPLVNDKYKDYKTLKSYRKKVVAILKAESRFLHMREIQDIAVRLEPSANEETLRSTIQQAVYGLKNIEDSPLVSFKVDDININTFWGSKNWLNEKGQIKQEHIYDKDQITANKKEKVEI
jgi:hypothetical protein